MEAENTAGQVIALLILVGFLTVWVAVAVRRERVRDRRHMRRLEKVSGRQEGTPRDPTRD